FCNLSPRLLRVRRFTRSSSRNEASQRMSQLTPFEQEKVRSLLGRGPTETETGIFTVMWSEHCSYKSSRIHLKKLPTKSARVLVGPGENAGIIDIGQGY